MVEALFYARLAVEVMVLLFGTLTLWLGFLRMAEKAGIVNALARWLAPLFTRLMPGVPRGHPALGLMTLNFAANALGLDNAATPMGLKAMRALQELNPHPDTATNAQILFLVLNASSLTLLPVTIFMYRMQQGAPDPTLVFLPILLATSASTLVGLLSVAAVQRLPLFSPVVLAYLLPVAGTGRLHGAVDHAERAALAQLSSLLGNLTLFALVVLFVCVGAPRKVAVYEAFIDGAKEGFDVAKGLPPYTVAMLCAVGCFAPPGPGLCADAIRWRVELLGMDARFVDALPTALVNVFGQCGARHADRNHAEPGRGQLRCAGGRHCPGQHRNHVLCAGGVLGRGHPAGTHAVACALLAELAGVVAAIVVCYRFLAEFKQNLAQPLSIKRKQLLLI